MRPDDTRRAILIAVLIFTLALGFLTLDVLIRTGPDVLTLTSLVIVAMFAFGVVGALREPPDRR
jgi:hypothetical protein